jgi:hypothetical protein
MGAFDSVIDRCEDTVRCTGHSILCWLLSSRPQSRRESPFNLVAENNSEVRKRGIQKQFLAFTLRIYGMPSDSRRDVIIRQEDETNCEAQLLERASATRLELYRQCPQQCSRRARVVCQCLFAL